MPPEDRDPDAPAADAEPPDESAEIREASKALARVHGLDDGQTALLSELLEALVSVDGTADEESSAGPLTARLVDALRDPLLAEAFLSGAITGDPRDGVQLERFSALLLDHDAAHGRARAAPCWLRARALDRLGRTLEVEPLLDEALRADPAFRPALELAGRYASDRGNAAEAVRLLRRAGITDDDGYLAALSSMVVEPRRDIGRNDPCPCGSGRKYKQCHLVRTTLDLAERAPWLYRKAAEHVGDGPWRTRMLEIATTLRGEEELSAEAAWMALTDPLVADLVLVRDRAFDEFLDQRGPLLPGDERALAERWSGIDLSVFELTDVRDDSIEVRDLGSGHLHVVPDNLSSRVEQIGRVFLARILPLDDDQHAFVGGLADLGFDDADHEDSSVDDVARREILELLAHGSDGIQVAAALARFAAAEAATAAARRNAAGARRPVTSEGEDLCFCTTWFTVADPDAAERALDGRPDLRRAPDEPDEEDDRGGALAGLPSAFGTDDDAGDGAGSGEADARWIEEIEVDGQRWIRGTITRRGTSFEVRTNAEARHERLLAVLRSVVPDAHLTRQRRTPVPQLPS